MSDDTQRRDDMPRRDDPIHQLFRKLREGFSDIVVNLVERVDRRIQLFIDDERHQQPEADKIAGDGLRDVATLFSSLVPSSKSGLNSDESLGTDQEDDD